MASLLLKKTATIIYVKCVCNVKHLEQKEKAEQKIGKEQKEQKIKNPKITFKISHVALLKESQLQNWDSFFLIKKNQTSRNMTY